MSDHAVEVVELAKRFADLDAEQQAQFFDAVYIEVKGWSGGMPAFRTQMLWAYASDHATPGGREIMQAIASIGE